MQNQSKILKTEAQVKGDPVFASDKDRIGIHSLRRFISRLLAKKMEPMLPELRNKANEDLKNADRDLEEQCISQGKKYK